VPARGADQCERHKGRDHREGDDAEEPLGAAVFDRLAADVAGEHGARAPEGVVAALGDDETRLTGERAAATIALAEVERKLDALTHRALLGAEAFDAGTVTRLRTELENQRPACQIAVNDLTCDVLDVEATLAYAEHVLTNLPRLWRERAPTHRQALGRVLFPARVQFDGVSCQTATWIQRFGRIFGGGIGFGGPDRDRTGDLLNAIQARSQLRHRPTRAKRRTPDCTKPAGRGQTRRLEPRLNAPGFAKSVIGLA
jgi:hypothetical protein